MEGSLNQQQIDYLFFHLYHHINVDDKVKNALQFGQSSQSEIQPSIYFPLSDKKLDLEQVTYYQQLPILFPITKNANIFEVKGQSIYFQHDILKSAFYLLSGYQELNCTQLDEHQRFPYAESIQAKLNFAHIPLVNYYFQWIIEAIERFSAINGYQTTRKKVFKKPVFSLTHDVDRVKYYSLQSTISKTIQLLGLKKKYQPKHQLWKALKEDVIHFITFSKNDPWWNFDHMLSLEKKLKICSTWFFLSNTGHPLDAKYSFNQKKLRLLFQQLIEQGHEVGLHASYNAINKTDTFSNEINSLSQSAQIQVVGNRSHYLCFNTNTTPLLLQNAGIQYDATLGFAEHEGFRNSYCHPFQLYNFAQNQPFELWQLPLVAMEVSLLQYQNLDFQTFENRIHQIATQVVQFNGIFSLLWHNCRLLELEHPGIHSFYEELLQTIMNDDFTSSTAIEIVNIIQQK